MKRDFLIIIFIFAVVIQCLSQTKDNLRDLTILHWNDFHAHNLPYQVTKKDSAGNKITYYVGGTSSMLGYLKNLRDDKSLVLNAGDEYQGSPICSITKGFSQIPLLNLYKLDAFVLGNHDFDYGVTLLDSALKQANFVVLSANLYDVSKQSLAAEPYTIKELNSIKVGIIGISPEELSTLTLPQNIENIRILNTDSVVAVAIEELKKQHCNLIVLLSHNGVERDSIYAVKFHRDIDVIIGGHSHSTLYKPKIVDGVIICQAGYYGRFLGKLDLKVDIEKDTVANYFEKLYETAFDSSIYDKDAQYLVENMVKQIEPEMERVIGSIDKDLNKTTIGLWQAEIIKERVKSDIGFLNSGGIRGNIKKGDIKVKDIWEINPFDNTIVVVTVKGNLLKQMMENYLRKIQTGDSRLSNDNLLVSGVYVEYSSQKLNQNVDFIEKFLVNGTPLDENISYTIATNNYVASQTEKYFSLTPEQIKIEDTNIIMRDYILEYIEQQKNLKFVYKNRIVDLSK
ncbi:MAG: bifunctional metallophosphatase/5'-nucleotidase [Ignavibacteria bacterium]